MQWGWEPREWDPFEDAADDPAFVDLKEEQRSAVCKQLEPGEEAVWAERACPPGQPVVRAFPAFFVSVLCGLSGFALSVVFGIHGLIRMSLEMTLYTIGLAPLVLGSFVVLGLFGRWGRYLRDRWRLSRTFYVLTDRRALIGLEAADEEHTIAFQSVRQSAIDDTLCIEKETDGLGDVCFLSQGSVLWPEVGFVGVSAARQVDELVREVLLNTRTNYGFEI
jgi:hypothetical protein